MNAAAIATPCPQCGRDVPADAPEGLCPRCVAGVNFPDWLTRSAGAAPLPVLRHPPAGEDPGFLSVVALFPQFQIEACLGRGGMGTVYKARQPRLDRWVALKVLAPGREGDPRFAERFAREAQAHARLRHPGIVAIHDFGEIQGRFYLVMEYVEGVTLRARMRGERLTLEAAAAVVLEICEALQYAHEQGVVHRDIKPENVLLDAQGRVRLADFGIAKRLGAAAPLEALTEARARVGTPHYMAPEQVERPDAVDHRADLYALGVVFYELLTGELPLGRFDPPSARASQWTRFDDVVLRALEKDPERRFPTAASMGAATAAALAGTTRSDDGPHAGADGGPGLRAAGTVRRLGAVLRACAALNLAGLGLALGAAVVWVALDRRGLVTGATGTTWAAWLQDEAHAGARALLGLVLALSVSGAWMMSLGARAMGRLESYRLALATCALAMFLPPACVVGFPLGWWGLVVLGRRTTQSAFQRHAAGRQPPRNFPGARFARAAALVLLPLVTVLAVVEWMARRPSNPPRPSMEEIDRGKDAVPAAVRTLNVPPVVIATVPVAGETNVDPRIGEIRVTFSKPMRADASLWGQPVGGGHRVAAAQPRLLDDGRTFLLPVRLEPGRTYAVGINAETTSEFADRDGRPAVSYLIVFQTRGTPVPDEPSGNRPVPTP